MVENDCMENFSDFLWCLFEYMYSSGRKTNVIQSADQKNWWRIRQVLSILLFTHHIYYVQLNLALRTFLVRAILVLKVKIVLILTVIYYINHQLVIGDLVLKVKLVLILTVLKAKFDCMCTYLYRELAFFTVFLSFLICTSLSPITKHIDKSFLGAILLRIPYSDILPTIKTFSKNNLCGRLSGKLSVGNSPESCQINRIVYCIQGLFLKKTCL